MAKYQYYDEDEYTDFELERQILSSEYRGYGQRHADERKPIRYDKYDRYRERDRQREARSTKSREKYREPREHKVIIEKYKVEHSDRNLEAYNESKHRKRHDRVGGYRLEYPKGERRKAIGMERTKTEEAAVKLRESKTEQKPKKVIIKEKRSLERKCHSDSEIDIVFSRARSMVDDERGNFMKKKYSLRRGHFEGEGQDSKVKRNIAEDKSRQKQKKRKENTDALMRRSRTKSSPELRESSNENCLDSSRDSHGRRSTMGKPEDKRNTKLPRDTLNDVDIGFQPCLKENGFRAKMFHLLLEHVKDLTKEAQEYKEERKKMQQRIIVLEEEAKVMREKAKQPESLAFKRRQTKKLDETFSALSEQRCQISKNPSFKRELRSILAEVQGKYYKQLREHEQRMQEVQEKAENDIQDLMKNIVEKYVKVSEIKERQQHIGQIVAGKINLLAKNSDDKSPPGNKLSETKTTENAITDEKKPMMSKSQITTRRRITDKSVIDDLPVKASQNENYESIAEGFATSTLPKSLKGTTPASPGTDRGKTYQFYFPENKVQTNELFKTTEKNKEEYVEPRVTKATLPSSPLARSPVTPNANRSSPVAMPNYEYWHSRLTQGTKTKALTLRNIT